MSDSPAQNEATGTPNTVEHFGRTWELPSAVRFSGITRLNEIVGAQLVRNWDTAIAEAFLSSDDFAALAEIDPTLDELDEFGNKIGVALGLRGSGNS